MQCAKLSSFDAVWIIQATNRSTQSVGIVAIDRRPMTPSFWPTHGRQRPTFRFRPTRLDNFRGWSDLCDHTTAISRVEPLPVILLSQPGFNNHTFDA